jgi:prepilin-type N-terminal cleavage/methylation domain-containing protein
MNRDRVGLGTKAGFTMVELMIVVSIIGMLAILSLPGYNRFMQNWKLNGETQQFASVLRTARSAAVMKNTDVVFTFDMDTNTYWYYEDLDRNRSRGASEYLSSTYELTPGVIITAHTFPARTLIFGSKGNTSNSGTITLRNSNHKSKGIRIYGGTGNISVD